jgi:hypothetical protein
MVGGLVIFVVAGGLLLIHEVRKLDPGTARYVAAHIKDPPDDCETPDFAPLWNPELAAWKRRSLRSSNFSCGGAGPVVQWAYFRSSADLEAALRASGDVSGYICRTDVELIRLIGFSRTSQTATCSALRGRPLTRGA